MRVCRSGAELREWMQRESRGLVGFVPTMGALHEGHLSLVRQARDLSDLVVMSVFVNPLQFGPNEDPAAYPRDEDRDLRVAETEKVDVVFAPSADEMYPAGNETRVTVGPIGSVLEGASRPGHFDGVATVVAKLFNLVQPDLAFFGQKDAQQVSVIKRLVEGMSFPTKVIVCPTVRDPDGLAMSSRNVYLSSTGRDRALSLWRSLQVASGALAAGAEPQTAAAEARAFLSRQEGVEPGYLEAVDPATFEPALLGGDVLFLVAARIGKTRLIDNLLIEEPDRGLR